MQPKTHSATCKRFFEDDAYLLSEMIEDTGLSGQECMDLLFDYKERVFGEWVEVRNYGIYA